jgi:glutaredoxin 3
MIIIYTTPTCEWCEKLKKWLKRKKVDFEDRDTTEETEWRDELLEKSDQLAVPVIDINGKIIVGFNEAELEKALSKES